MEFNSWKSDRAIEVEVAAYRVKRFEDYMLKVDSKELPQDIALTALRQEIEYQELFVGTKITNKNYTLPQA